MATPSDPVLSRLEAMNRWLEKVAENTAALAKAAGKGGGAARGAGAAAEPEGTRFERAMEALGKRFESALARWSNAPVERLVNAGIDKSLQALGNSITTVLGQARGFAHRGLAGTVEQARLDYAQEQLARQFAAIFMPVTNALTYFTTRVTQLGLSLNGEGQNRLLGMGLGAAAGMRLGGPIGGLAGGLLGGHLMGSGSSETDGLIGAAGGALLGFRAGGIYGAVAGAGLGYVASRGDYGELRRTGSSRAAAAGGATLAGLGDLSDFATAYNPFTAPVYWGARALGYRGAGDTARDMMGVRTGPGLATAAARRDVTPFQAEMGEAGSAYFRMQASVIRTTAGAGFEDAGILKPVVDLLVEIYKLLARVAGVEVREPRSAEAARA